jgi:cytosine/adenosine deaminase-related metal-dependent hydrolase
VLGARAGALPGGRLEPGAAADFVLVDWDALDDDSLFPVEPFELLLARGSGAHIDTVVIGGRTVVAGGRLQGIDEAALRAELVGQLRARIAAQPSVHAWRETLDALSEDLGPFYRTSAWFGCC